MFSRTFFLIKTFFILLGIGTLPYYGEVKKDAIQTITMNICFPLRVIGLLGSYTDWEQEMNRQVCGSKSLGR